MLHPNGNRRRPRASPLPDFSAAPVSFGAWLDAQFRGCVPHPGTHIELAIAGRHRGAQLDGVVESTHPHGFVLRGQRYRSFVAYRDLYCADGRITVLRPDPFLGAVDRVRLKARDRLPCGLRSEPAGALFFALLQNRA